MLNWNLVITFIALVREGSVSKASKVLKISQPTIGRHITDLEEQLKTTLFERCSTGFTLTQAGQLLFEKSVAMEASANELVSSAAEFNSKDRKLLISAPQDLATFWLPKLVNQIHDFAPGLHIEIVSSDTDVCVIKREADIAISYAPPVLENVIFRRIRNVSVGLYAHKELVSKCVISQCEVPFVCSTRGEVSMERELLKQPIRNKTFAFLNSDCSITRWELVRAGIGASFMLTIIGNKDPRLTRLPLITDTKISDISLWLYTHREIRTSKIMKKVFDHIAESFG